MRKLKIMTVLGTRPEIIRLSRILPKLATVSNHTLVHTGQNFDKRLSEIFFEELNLEPPDCYLGVRSTNAAAQIGEIITKCDEMFRKVAPDRLLILGDTNSSLCSIMAKRRGIRVLHMEAGNRCYDDRVPEEINRRVIDHSSDILMPYTELSRHNLEAEGIDRDRIRVIGNPIGEVIQHYAQEIDAAAVLSDLQLEAGRFFLVTLHRAENVDVKARLGIFMSVFANLAVSEKMPVVVSTHPRMRHKLEEFEIPQCKDVILAEPFGFFDFVKLEKTARMVLTDSGTVQEECCILGVPAITLRDVTERPETIECGSNILSGCNQDMIFSALSLWHNRKPIWAPPEEYTRQNVSDTVTNVAMSYYR